MAERRNEMQRLMDRIRAGEAAGIPSYCTGNRQVIETILARAGRTGRPVLIEATANQVNQYGGYTGMTPAEYHRWVSSLARDLGVSEEKLILGGDHLGPLTWTDLPEAEAMDRAAELVRQYARAGFTKIHLDTSMKLVGDPEGPLDVATSARRGVELYRVCMDAYEERKREIPDAIRPVFVIGSEVPIPGGAREKEDGLAVTRPEDFEHTVDTYRTAFDAAGLPGGMDDVIAVVVQPGVEFGDDQIFLYDREAAAELTVAVKTHPGITLEGHSTDYQSPACLRRMVEDGIGILKVGPALTYALREALFALSMMEAELLPLDERADLPGCLEAVMVEDPKNWRGHYHGDEGQLALARRYSFSDRARYYMGEPRVAEAIDGLLANLGGGAGERSGRNGAATAGRCGIPMNMLHQYMPRQFDRVRSGELALDPKELVRDAVEQVLAEYEYAAGMISAGELGR